jgi:hypothetical protein
MVMAVNPAMSYEMPLLRSSTRGAETFYLGPFDSGPFTSVRIEFDVESETGTSTTDAELQYYSEANGEWTDWLDKAGTVMKINNYADGDTGRRFIDLGIGNTGGADADGVLVVGNNAYYDTDLVPVWRIKVTTAGAPVISASLYWKR